MVHFGPLDLHIKRWVIPELGGLFRIKTPHPPRKNYHRRWRFAENRLCSVQDNETVLPTLWQCHPSGGA